MLEAIAPEGAVNDNLEADKSLDNLNTQPLADGAETSVAKGDSLLNNVAVESKEPSTGTEEIDWKSKFDAQKKNSDAENKRKREKNKKLTSKLERAEARVKELEPEPTLESVGNDYDALQRAERSHGIRQGIAEEKLNDARFEADSIEPEVDYTEVNAAAQEYNNNVRGRYLSKEGSVSEQALINKEALINEALSMRDNPSDIAKIINRLNSMDNTVEVMLNLANNPKALIDLANADIFDMGAVLSKAKLPELRSNAPEPVPSIGGATGVTDDTHDKSTPEGLRASLQAKGIKI
jgi:hypothetical protein